jgi:hypothetical protein
MTHPPRLIPPPPNYPPFAPPPEPRIITVQAEPAQAEPGLLARLRPVHNITAAGAALAPVFGGYSLATGIATLLHDMDTTGHLEGAWTVAALVIAVTLYTDRTRRGWPARVLLAASLLGTALALPWLEAVLYLMTGVTT